MTNFIELLPWVAAAIGVMLVAVIVAVMVPHVQNVIAHSKQKLQGAGAWAKQRGTTIVELLRGFIARAQTEPSRAALVFLERIPVALARLGASSANSIAESANRINTATEGLTKTIEKQATIVQSGAPQTTSTPGERSIGSLITTLALALLIGVVNSALLGFFFDGVQPIPLMIGTLIITWGPVFGAFFFLFEFSVGLMLDHAEANKANGAETFWNRSAWYVLGALMCVELAAYMTLSHRIGLEKHLGLALSSPLGLLANNFLVPMASVTLVVADLGRRASKISRLRRAQRETSQDIKKSTSQVAKLASEVDRYKTAIVDLPNRSKEELLAAVGANSNGASTDVDPITAVARSIASALGASSQALPNQPGAAASRSAAVVLRSVNTVFANMVMAIFTAFVIIGFSYLVALQVGHATPGLTRTHWRTWLLGIMFPSAAILLGYWARRFDFGGRYSTLMHEQIFDANIRRFHSRVAMGLIGVLASLFAVFLIFSEIVTPDDYSRLALAFFEVVVIAMAAMWVDNAFVAVGQATYLVSLVAIRAACFLIEAITTLTIIAIEIVDVTLQLTAIPGNLLRGIFARKQQAAPLMRATPPAQPTNGSGAPSAAHSVPPTLNKYAPPRTRKADEQNGNSPHHEHIQGD